MVSDSKKKVGWSSRNSFNPLYRGTWSLTLGKNYESLPLSRKFQSAISRYLVSDLAVLGVVVGIIASFNPLYRGTWSLTGMVVYCGNAGIPLFQSAISRYLVSDGYWGNDHTVPGSNVSIRYIAVPGL